MSSRTDLVARLYGGAESQPERATQRRWISSGRVASSRPTSARDKISNPSAQVAARPSTAAPHNHGLQQLQQEPSGVMAGRPMSAKHRPLSGNVFLKKTVKNGWVACSVHNEEELWGETGLDDEQEDVGEGWGSETMLDGLLKSKKLMNSKQVHHVDWTAGEIAIPEFHCQRCRDHWYGLTSFPCDEEMARLIREGLWATGQGPVDRDLLFGGRGVLSARDRRHILKEGGAGGGDKLNLPPIVDKTDSGSSLDGSWSGGGRGDAKKGRRITFNMQTEEFRYSQDGGVGSNRAEWRSSAQLDKGTEKQSSEVEESEISSHQSGMGSSQSFSSQNVGRPQGGVGSEGSEQTGDKVPEGLSLHLEKTGHGLLWQDGPLSGLDGRGQERQRGSNGSGMGNTGSHGDGSGQGSTRVSDEDIGRHRTTGGLSDGISKYGGGGAHVGEGGRLSRGGLNSGERHGKGGGALSNGVNSSLGGSAPKDASMAVVEGSSQAAGRGQGQSDVESSGRQGSDSSKESGCEGKGESGGAGVSKSTAASSDAGKNVRVQGAGFIARASSPTGSEWGDPTHARMFIANTACSSRAGSSLGGRVQDDELGKSRSDPGLPQSRSKLTADDFIWGPSLTRAYTFSYHRQLKPLSQQTSQPAGRSKIKANKRRK